MLNFFMVYDKINYVKNAMELRAKRVVYIEKQINQTCKQHK